MILGENIGTTVTANLAALVGNVHAKRAREVPFLLQCHRCAVDACANLSVLTHDGLGDSIRNRFLTFRLCRVLLNQERMEPLRSPYSIHHSTFSTYYYYLRLYQ